MSALLYREGIRCFDIGPLAEPLRERTSGRIVGPVGEKAVGPDELGDSLLLLEHADNGIDSDGPVGHSAQVDVSLVGVIQKTANSTSERFRNSFDASRALAFLDGRGDG